ncbi:MAG: CbiX/SirB N-terminal domain-containing protein [FCB group bacterium]|nr:CbiX/SirB N-terminal domain-containing protein [FCB group bacterium]
MAKQKLALLIIAHGSPSPQWNEPVLRIEQEVESVMSERGDNPFDAIRVAMMEFSEPSISTVMEELEKTGIQKLYALPLFIAQSGHSLYDIPTILGLYSEREMTRAIEEEGIGIIDTRIKITMGPTLNTGDVLKKIMLDRVKELSDSPDSEAVVLLAHGDPDFEPIWDSVCGDIGSYICSRSGIDYFNYAFVEVGQSFITEGAPVILKTAEKCETTIVVGLYLSMGVEYMANNSMLNIGRMNIESREMFVDKNIHFARRGLLPDKRVSEWIVDRALEWVETMR